jgi:hypothetical protein
MSKYLDFSTGNNYTDEAIENYLMYGFEPGGFLMAVLTNNLFLAASRADHWNKERLSEISLQIYHNMPPLSFGNSEIVKDWLLNKEERRSKYAYRKEKEYTFKVLGGKVREEITDPPF